MPLFSFFLSPLGIAIYLLVAFCHWYFWYDFEVGINGRPGVFKSLWKDLKYFSPGGLKRRTERVRQIVKPSPYPGSGFLHGANRHAYSYEEIRERNLYEEVARYSFGTPGHFWGEVIVRDFFLGPIILILSILIVLVRDSGRIWSYSMQWNPPPG